MSGISAHTQETLQNSLSLSHEGIRSLKSLKSGRELSSDNAGAMVLGFHALKL